MSLLGINHDQLYIADSLLTITDDKRNVLLADCTARVELSNGVTFSLDAMETIHHVTGHDAVVSGGGDDTLPRIEWRTTLIAPDMARLTLTITNSTLQPLAIERMDLLDCPNGYRKIPAGKLYFRRTGWQSFSPSTVRQKFDSKDPWLQPPLFMPMLPPVNSSQQPVAWMTVLQADAVEPLLVGFESAKKYLGMIQLRDDTVGHRLVASNYQEGVELPPGETVTSEPLLLIWGEDQEVLLSKYGTAVAKAMSARKAARPTGWDSWYYYFKTFKNVTEKAVLSNVEAIVSKKLPFEYVQIDDGYQTYFGDWLSVDKRYFPHGMKYVADKIKAAGYKPGIWLSPFMADARSEVVRKHPEWFLHDDRDRLIDVNRHGDTYWPAPNYGLDLTHPEAYAWAEKVLRTMCDEWGYEYLKVDFVYAACLRARRYDPALTSVQAYRRGLELIRTVAGDRFVLGCGAPLLCSVGLVEAMRISTDIAVAHTDAATQAPDATRPLSRDAVASLWSHAWMNGRLWVNDPDTIRVRQHDIAISWTEVEALAVMVALCSGSVINGDNLPSLEPEGLALMSRLFPLAEVQARVVGKYQKRPHKLTATVIRGDGSWHLIARYNWSAETRPFRFVPSRWGLPMGRYHIYDLLRQRYIGTQLYKRSADIPSYGAGLLSLCPASEHPQVVATEGHLLGPAGDLQAVNWDGRTLTVTLAEGHQKLPKLYVHVPLKYRLLGQKGCVVTGKHDGVAIVEPQAVRCSLRFKPRLSLGS